MRVRAILTETAGLWTATARDLGVHGEGATPEEAVRDLREAIAAWAADRGCALKVAAAS